MILTESFQFTLSFEVGSYQVNPEGNIRLSCLADLFQEIAWGHADSADFGRNLSEISLMWALARLEIEIVEFPKWGDSICLYTGSKGADKLFAFRDFLVTDRHGRVLARGMSSWLLLNSSTKRIQKAEVVLPPALYDPMVKPDHQPQKLVAKGDLVATEVIKVRFSDLDLNYHVNNTAYIRWVENLLADRKVFPSKIAINYQAECFGGDLVELRLFEGASESFVEGRIGEKLVFIVAF
ncbi:acyl-ACP thioesterase [Algoriphagus sp. H41]|uniref:Acyl-ACP thioesterase n=1 Tax=Algoriphagus oliviformis TaxID=2811231 RepID=A0ABS3C9Y1_9BACT|nr:acyl-ACP thioesterase domain-containing protein [Algoriphagus oliviformis]MBN7812980.1 acyl-ACP thioesterase [Algoriphagus oliviformis]